jgi:hypothetical protein
MKLYLFIPKTLKREVYKEIHLSEQFYSCGKLQESFQHLERAHILGQSWPIEHTMVHWKMLIFAFKIKNKKEILGQLPRLLFGGVKSFIGKIPLGNTGGSDVSPLRAMDIPDDLMEILNAHSG